MEDDGKGEKDRKMGREGKEEAEERSERKGEIAISNRERLENCN